MLCTPLFRLLPELSMNQILSSYGRASVKAYTAYKDQRFLDFALSSWFFGRRYTLSQQEVSAGKSPVKSFPLSDVCNGGRA
jgi:hypothetical protein